MKTSEKNMLLKHIKKDSKEFRDQLKDDKKLRQTIEKSSSKLKKKS